MPISVGPYLGHFTTSDTVNIMFSSYDSNDPRASSAISGFVVGDIKVYKDGSTTERSSTAGFTATTSFDTLTGINHVAIDLSDDTDAGFYAEGSRYDVVVSSVTLDAGTVSAHIGSFSIGVQTADVERVDGSATSATKLSNWLTAWATGTVQSDGGTAITLDAGGSAVNDFYNGDVLFIYAGTGAGQAKTILDYVGSTKVATVDEAFSTTLASDSDYVIIPAGGVSLEAVNGDTSVVTNMADFFDTTMTELSSVPSATPTAREALMLLFMALRNKIDVDTGSSSLEVHNDAGTAIGTKSISDDGTTYSESKMT